ncbi:DUF3164 family protein [bacterium]|jgi:hypothetical protein|nr:DUF3164 family protein [bacterium]
MPKTKELDGKVYWVDAEGSLKPETSISPADKKKEELVDAVFEYVAETKTKLETFKYWTQEVVATYVEKQAKKAKVAGWKGNIRIINYDGTKRICVSKKERMDFNEKLQFAKAKFDEWIIKRTEGADEVLAELVQKAFEVDKEGEINRSFLFRLLRYSISDPDFKKAQELLKQSMQTSGTKEYILFQEKDEHGEWKTITLDFAAL